MQNRVRIAITVYNNFTNFLKLIANYLGETLYETGNPFTPKDVENAGCCWRGPDRANSGEIAQ